MKATCPLLLLGSLSGILGIPLLTLRAGNTTVDPTKITCDAEYLNEANSDSTKRWKAAEAEYAYDVVQAAWTIDKISPNPSKLKYSEYVSDYFNGKDLMMCDEMADVPCGDTVTCSDVNQPAGWLIMNSFVALHVMRNTIYTSLGKARVSLLSSISLFQNTFSPVRTESTSWISDLVNVFQLVVGVASAYTWNIALKEAKIIENSNYLSFAKDSANAAIAAGFNIGKTRIPTAASLTDDINVAMGAFFDAWEKAELDFLHTLFHGDIDGLAILAGLTRNGMALDMTRDLNLSGFIDMAQKIVYAKLMPTVWSSGLASLKAFPKQMYPMILMILDDCVTSGDNLPKYVSEENAGQIVVCHDGHTFYVGYPTWDGLVRDGINSDSIVSKTPTVHNLQINPLPGGTNDELDGTKWKGVTLEDLVISSYEGWRANLGRNGYIMRDYINPQTTQTELIMENGIRTPGFISMTMCTADGVAQAAKDYFAKMNDKIDPADIRPLPCADAEMDVETQKAWGLYREPTVLGRKD